MDIGSQIRKIRESRNVTQEYMAARLQISKTSYGNIERNMIKRVTLPMLMAIAKLLHVHYTALLGDDETIEASGINALLDGMHHLLEKMDGIEKQLQRLQ